MELGTSNKSVYKHKDSYIGKKSFYILNHSHSNYCFISHLRPSPIVYCDSDIKVDEFFLFIIFIITKFYSFTNCYNIQAKLSPEIIQIIVNMALFLLYTLRINIIINSTLSIGNILNLYMGEVDNQPYTFPCIFLNFHSHFFVRLSSYFG